MNNTDLVVVDTNERWIQCFTTQENAISDVQRINNKKREDVTLFDLYSVIYPDNAEYWIKRREETKKSNIVVMTVDEFNDIERKYYLEKPIIEITEDDYEFALNVLPPMKWQTVNGVEMFLMSEFTSGVYTSQYATKSGKYYCKIVDAYDKSTWIDNFIR